LGRPSELLAFTTLLTLGWRWPLPVLVAAIALHSLLLLRRRVVGSPNHPFLELVLLLVFVVAPSGRGSLAFFQAVVASVWAYAGLQKALSAEVRSGLFFYRFLANPEHLLRSQRWLIRDCFPLPKSMHGRFGSFDPAALRFARLLGWGTVLVELLLPSFVLLCAGFPLAVLCMVALALCTGLAAREWSFMTTNLIFSLLFFRPFEPSALLEALMVPGLLVPLLWFSFWPPIHALSNGLLRFSAWRLFGWGMYAVLEPSVKPLSAEGVELPRAKKGFDAATGHLLMRGFALTRIPGLAAYAQRAYQRWSCDGEVVAFELRRYLHLGGKYGTEYTLLPCSDRSPWRQAVSFEVHDESSDARYQASRAGWLGSVLLARSAAGRGASVDTSRCSQLRVAGAFRSVRPAGTAVGLPCGTRIQRLAGVQNSPTSNAPARCARCRRAPEPGRRRRRARSVGWR
jgi:hypothetical protein